MICYFKRGTSLERIEMSIKGKIYAEIPRGPEYELAKF